MSEDRNNWGSSFAKLQAHLDRALDTLRGLDARVRGNGDRAAEPPPEFAALLKEVSEARSLAGDLSELLYARPLRLLLGGQRMPREAFHVLVALGVLPGDSLTGDAYADFQMLHYEDEKQRGYIVLDEQPSAGVVRLHLGLWPEQVRWHRLREEQREFFERYLPEVAARFGRDRES